jgi:hypothetical protein
MIPERILLQMKRINAVKLSEVEEYWELLMTYSVTHEQYNEHGSRAPNEVMRDFRDKQY